MEVENLLHKIRDRAVRLNRTINQSVRERRAATRVKELNWIDLRVYQDEYAHYQEEAYDAMHGIYRNLLKFIATGDAKYSRRVNAGYTRLDKIREREQRFTRDAWHSEQNIPSEILQASQNRFDYNIFEWNASIMRTLLTGDKTSHRLKTIAERAIDFMMRVGVEMDARMKQEEEAIEERQAMDADTKEFLGTADVFMKQAERLGAELMEATYGYYQLRHIDTLYRILEIYDELDRMWAGFIRFDNEFEGKVNDKTRRLFRTSMYGFFRTLNKMSMDLLTKLHLR